MDAVPVLPELAAAMRRVGARILRCRDDGITDGTWEGTQFKAAADLLADECLRDELRRLADIPIVSEEDVASHAANRPSEYWLIDPIDGTASFAHGFTGFVCQAAWMKDNEPWLASVYAPALDRLYMAERGMGSTVNGQPMRVRPCVREQLTLVDNYRHPMGIAEFLVREMPCVNYMESGSIGLKICLVAEGTADIFVKDVVVRDWDVAAPNLVLREAGGVLTQFSGQPFDYTGPFEKLGVVATSTAALLREVHRVAASRLRDSPST